MKRLRIVYTLSPGTEEREAMEQLRRTQEELPQGASLWVYRRSDPIMEQELRWVPFGDLVQIIDFETAAQADAFADSPARKAQNKRTRGFFSNIASFTCPMVEQ